MAEGQGQVQQQAVRHSQSQRMEDEVSSEEAYY